MIDNSILQELLSGNQRFIAGQPQHPRQDAARRQEVASGQHPKAVVAACSDSRVPPEIIFDQGLGDLFVVRTAGQVVDDIALASIEYAVEHLHVPLVIVLGHKRCGAVQAAIAGGKARGHLDSLINAIKPAVESARDKAGDTVDNAVRANIIMTAVKLKTSEPVIAQAVKAGTLQVIGAYYDLDTGAVSTLN